MGPVKDYDEIYQKKTQLEHVLLRPDTYIGSIHKHTEVICFKKFLIFLKTFFSDDVGIQ